MKKKKNGKKTKKVIVTLSERDFEKLTAYARTVKASRPVAAKRMLKAQLASVAIEKKQRQTKNQLGLFDSMQIDIFNGTSKTE
ncbi:MAG: hypothetical protein J6X58_02955 [Bacteroidales bacterium]|nr:hypothetical protein [Bacteroidales bacterium]